METEAQTGNSLANDHAAGMQWNQNVSSGVLLQSL